jgi:hypothetical protein
MFWAGVLCGVVACYVAMKLSYKIKIKYEIALNKKGVRETG